MTDWPFLLTPLAVLAILLLFRFVGCASILGIEDWEAGEGPSGYRKTVLDDNPVSYWRLQDKQSEEPPGPTTPNTPVSGPAGKAKDETGNNHGTYKAVIVQPGAQFPDSPSAPQPIGGPSLTLEAPGLLAQGGDANTSLSVDGGYVEVPFSSSLLLKSFTVEAFVRPEWDPQETGLFRTVIALNTVAPQKTFGFGIFAGPDPEAQPPGSGIDVWQVWLADGTNWIPIKDPNRDLALVDFTKTSYVAATYDDTTKKLNMYVYVGGVNQDLDLAHPVSDVTVAYSPVADQTKSLLIGMHRPPVGGALPVYHPFKGRIQEVAVYDKALTVGRCPLSRVCTALAL